MRVPPSSFNASAPPDTPTSAASNKVAALLSPNEQARLAQAMMRRQGALSLRVASVFVILLLGLPLVNLYAPALAATPLFGFSASWLFLGVLFYPITILLSVYFVRHSDRIEAETAQAYGERADHAGSAGQEGSVQ